MLIEGATTPAQEVEPTNPATEVETETAETIPESLADEATDGAEGDQSTDTGDGTSEGTTAEQARLAGLREADYTRKTQELAEQRRQFEARRTQLDEVVNRGEALVQALSDEFQAEFKDVDWGKLAAEDPAEYVRKQHALSTRQQKLQAALYRLNEAKGLQSQTQQQELSQRLKDEQTKLVERLPEWKDQKRYAQESADISEYLTKAGYSSDEVSGVTDHRAVILARKAMLYDKMIAQSKVPTKPAGMTAAPPPPPPAPTKAKAAPSLETMSMRDFMETRRRQEAKRNAR